MADTIQEVLQAFAKGELVVVTDDDDREGEGDLIVAASFCTAEKMAFIIRHTAGCGSIRWWRITSPTTPPPSRSRSTTSPMAVPAFRRTNALPAAARSPIR